MNINAEVIKRYLLVIWMYIIGVIIVLIGLYTLFTSPGPSTFLIMILGLGIACIGTIRGKRLMASGVLKNIPKTPVKKTKSKKIEESIIEEVPEEFLRETEGIIASETELEEEEKPRIVKVLICPKCSTENNEENIYCYKCGKKLKIGAKVKKHEKKDIIAGGGPPIVRPGDKIVRIILCPKCGAENKEIDSYCFKCGAKLRTKTL